MSSRRLAIVGSREFLSHPTDFSNADGLISLYLSFFPPDLIISGGAEGIDKLAILKAVQYSIPYKEFFPTSPNWSAYKQRNKLIATYCTHLLCISHRLSRTQGAAWTANYAQGLGRHVERYVLPENSENSISPSE